MHKNDQNDLKNILVFTSLLVVKNIKISADIASLERIPAG